VDGSEVFLEKRVDQPNVFQYSKMRLGDGVPHKTAPKKADNSYRDNMVLVGVGN
jgi:hypothetical protein